MGHGCWAYVNLAKIKSTHKATKMMLSARMGNLTVLEKLGNEKI